MSADDQTNTLEAWSYGAPVWSETAGPPAALDTVRAYESPAVVDDFCRRFALPADEALALWTVTLDWLWVCASARYVGGPQPTIDRSLRIIQACWESFILRSSQYVRFCEDYLGGYLHYRCRTGLGRDALIERVRRDPGAMRAAFERRTRAQYEYVGTELGVEALHHWLTFLDRYDAGNLVGLRTRARSRLLAPHEDGADRDAGPRLQYERETGDPLTAATPVDEILELSRDRLALEDAEARELIGELGLYMDVCHGLSRSGGVAVLDELWRVFMLATQAYTAYCERYYGGYVHPPPAVGAGEGPFLSLVGPQLSAETVERWGRHAVRYGRDRLAFLAAV